MMSAYDFNTTIYTDPAAALRLVQDARCHFKASSLISAVTMGNHQLVDVLRSKGCAWPASTSLAYISNGSLDALIKAHEQGCPIHADAFEWAAQEGHLDILRWILEHSEVNERAKLAALGSAEHGKHEHIVEFLHLILPTA
jgi:hypothetical protein